MASGCRRPLKERSTRPREFWRFLVQCCDLMHRWLIPRQVCWIPQLQVLFPNHGIGEVCQRVPPLSRALGKQKSVVTRSHATTEQRSQEVDLQALSPRLAGNFDNSGCGFTIVSVVLEAELT